MSHEFASNPQSPTFGKFNTKEDGLKTLNGGPTFWPELLNSPCSNQDVTRCEVLTICFKVTNEERLQMLNGAPPFCPETISPESPKDDEMLKLVRDLPSPSKKERASPCERNGDPWCIGTWQSETLKVFSSVM
eukprot:gnl/MRDRNA2_/MRDRNA2_355175_c0_seq1.p1 gnl/MRDRNA2_/MRDRNA2_355175_c0~~gnl/MRDRNA2_/MRDRNA2_355175_c0_seq1.p1  ORF type:complete len:141 (-),score=24.20 gnl/MRDRNA2_/MRDRNA2_355175_c0_seq1:676-1074(-)